MSEWTYVIGDWETYYAPRDKYSLRVMDPPSYILDPRFEEIGAAWKINGEKTFWVDGPDVSRFITSLGNLDKVCFIAHNVLFDGGIASFRHGAVFGLYIDTLALSRALLGHVLPRHDLDTMARYLGVGQKGSTIHKVANMRRADIIAAGIYDEYSAYSCQDAELCWGSLLKLLPSMPTSEIELNDMVHRMALEPQFKLDVPILHEHLFNVRFEKDEALRNAGLDISTPAAKAASIGQLMSNDRFAAILQGMGITPPTKISLATGETTWAFAKTDEGMKDLLDHPDVAVQTIVAARLGIKSTIEETRTERFINAAGLHYPAWGDNVFPVALKPSGAHTHRLSGDWRWNQQNLSRPSRKRPRAMLRESIITPKGKSIVAGDEAQIELRVCADFCGQTDLLDELRQGGDPYSTQATKWFGYTVSKATVGERFCGKTGMLSCLGSAVPVLTKSGWKLIINVTVEDEVWDGVEWVSHDGLIFQGYKSTTEGSLDATPDHEVLTDAGWAEWQLVRTSPSLFRSALELAAGPLSTMSQSARHSAEAQDGTLHADAIAGGLELSTALVSKQVAQFNVTLAVGERLTPNSIGGTSRPWTTTSIDGGCSLVSALRRRDATHQKAEYLKAMEDAAFLFGQRGARIGRNSFGTYSMSRGGTTQHERWIASTTTKDTNPATFVSSLALKTWRTGEQSAHSNRGSNSLKPVYDLANAGPRQRFMVLSADGPLIVHNCQFQVGWRKYQASVKHLSMEQAGVQIVLSNVDAMRHVNIYRADKHKIAGMWPYLLNVVIPAMTRPDTDFMLGPIRVMFERIVLPNGLCLHYRGLHRSALTGEWLFFYGARLKKLYGGKLLENIVQALARIITMDVALRLKDVFARNYLARLALQAHDELAYVCPDECAADVKRLLEQEMRRPPAWMPNIPLNCEVGIGKCYGKTKG